MIPPLRCEPEQSIIMIRRTQKNDTRRHRDKLTRSWYFVYKRNVRIGRVGAIRRVQPCYEVLE